MTELTAFDLAVVVIATFGTGLLIGRLFERTGWRYSIALNTEADGFFRILFLKLWRHEVHPSQAASALVAWSRGDAAFQVWIDDHADAD